jgi:hypothetical protein
MKTILQLNTSILGNEGQSTRLANEAPLFLRKKKEIQAKRKSSPTPTVSSTN